MASRTNTQLLSLRGRAALVTGGAMGIGAAIAARLAAAGASVMIADINTDAAGAAARKIAAETAAQVEIVRADLARASDVRTMVEATLSAFGRLDILVNNAGVFPFASALEMTEAQWDHVLDVNLKGAFFAAQYAAKRMFATGDGGRIVNIASIDALHPTGHLAHYDSSKGGMLMMTKALALELGPHGITVNAIAPGGINTPGTAAAAPAAEQTPGVEEMSTAAFLARIPLRRMGEPDDIARVALFLASDASAYMTGAVLVVDGGYLLS